MTTSIDHNQVDTVLRASGSSWSAAQSHGLLCSRLAILGRDAGGDWLATILEGADSVDSLPGENAEVFDSLFAETYRSLAERQSDFAPLLPDDDEPLAAIATGLADWSEGFLHGLVTNVADDTLKNKLAAEPISDIIKDLLELTRAEVDDEADSEGNEQAIAELVEYLRVAAQLVYEELAELRHGEATTAPGTDTIH